MERGRPKKAEIVLSDHERAELQALAHSRSLPHNIVRRAQIILRPAEGMNNASIAGHFDMSRPIVGFWRKRYLTQGIAGLYDELLKEHNQFASATINEIRVGLKISR